MLKEFLANKTVQALRAGAKTAFTNVGQQLEKQGLMGLVEPFKNIASYGNVERAIGGAGIGAMANMAWYTGTAAAAAPLSILGVTQNDFSFGGLIGAGVRGAFYGGALGASAVSGSRAVAQLGANGALSSLRANAAAAPEYRSAIQRMGTAMGAIAPKTGSALASNQGLGMGMSQSLKVGSIMGTGSIPERIETVASSLSGIGSISKELGTAGFINQAPRSIMAGLGVGAAMYGMGHSMYNSSALSLRVPGNYGYR